MCSAFTNRFHFPGHVLAALIVHIDHELDAAQCRLFEAEVSAEANGKYVDVVLDELLDNDKLVLSHKGKNGKAAERTYMLNSKTEKTGNLTPGSSVSVHYRSENNQLVATAVQAMPHKMTSNAKKPVTKK